MKHYKALVNLIFFSIIIFLSCKSLKNQEINKNEINNIVKKEKNANCDIKEKDLVGYEKKLKTLCLSKSSDLKLQLTGEALDFSNNFSDILKSIYKSKFKTKVTFSTNKQKCLGLINFITNDLIKNDGEEYNIESSLILKIKIENGKLKIFEILMAG